MYGNDILKYCNKNTTNCNNHETKCNSHILKNKQLSLTLHAGNCNSKLNSGIHSWFLVNSLLNSLKFNALVQDLDSMPENI